ncbi:MAG: Hsp20/alpha crystallin family protein [Lentisphaerae bacterium]|nr:Hsp20/alpha crystallin family protein [Lentisphaerota bacterium]MBT4814241.1 Hsp20/alpha crystallin family protein [Lentisphaerota bacterium]MBT5604747.1 Hsp20/alpha crystallin family protein [Lentisphaerota bacterium]MBT7058079.1 Hsp20/alpha crystallin family protein [Lentisphaerota bacterium]MBT7841767.1 Hsp20/alpha crystallin family protein [Lentisphaerota bacterium]
MSNRAVTKSETSPATVDRTDEGAVHIPRVDIRETESVVVVKADMPGVDEKSVTIDVEGRQLRLEGRFSPTAPEGYALRHHEYTTGSYERTFALGNQIDQGRIKATVANGVLEIILPKAKEAQARKIAVKAA